MKAKNKKIGLNLNNVKIRKIDSVLNSKDKSKFTVNLKDSNDDYKISGFGFFLTSEQNKDDICLIIREVKDEKIIPDIAAKKIETEIKKKLKMIKKNKNFKK